MQEDEEGTGWLSKYELYDEGNICLQNDTGYLREDYSDSTVENIVNLEMGEDVGNGDMNDTKMEEYLMNKDIEVSVTKGGIEDVIVEEEEVILLEKDTLQYVHLKKKVNCRCPRLFMTTIQALSLKE